jgi:hypothetical protein
MSYSVQSLTPQDRLPKQARYQTAPHPELILRDHFITTFNMVGSSDCW